MLVLLSSSLTLLLLGDPTPYLLSARVLLHLSTCGRSRRAAHLREDTRVAAQPDPLLAAADAAGPCLLRPEVAVAGTCPSHLCPHADGRRSLWTVICAGRPLLRIRSPPPSQPGFAGAPSPRTACRTPTDHHGIDRCGIPTSTDLLVSSASLLKFPAAACGFRLIPISFVAGCC